MYRILIADDEPMALYSTAHTFPWADWGFDPPVLMTEAPAALDKLRTERFDAAIVDIRMPQMTGIDLIRLSGEAGLQTVFIVLSGYSDFSYVQTALRLSTFDYCLKPILPDAAQAALERLSGRIHDIRVGSDPAFLATLSSTAPLKPLFTQRGLPVPEGMLSMVLLSAEKPETLPPLLNGFQASLSFWADANEVLLFTPMPEQAEVARRACVLHCACIAGHPQSRSAIAAASADDGGAAARSGAGIHLRQRLQSDVFRHAELRRCAFERRIVPPKAFGAVPPELHLL